MVYVMTIINTWVFIVHVKTYVVIAGKELPYSSEYYKQGIKATLSYHESNFYFVISHQKNISLFIKNSKIVAGKYFISENTKNLRSLGENCLFKRCSVSDALLFSFYYISMNNFIHMKSVRHSKIMYIVILLRKLLIERTLMLVY